MRLTIVGFLPPISTMTGLGNSLREVLVEVEADLERAGEDDAVDAVVLLELGADGLARARHHVEDAVRAGRRRASTRRASRPSSGASLRRLVHDRVAGDERAARRAARRAPTGS